MVMIGLVRPTGLIISMAECYTGGRCIDRILITLRSILRDIGFSGSIRLNLLRLMQLILTMSKSICLYRCREMARNNIAFSIGPMLEKETLATNRGNHADWFRNLGLSSKLLN